MRDGVLGESRMNTPLYSPRMPRRNTGSCHQASMMTNVLNHPKDSALAGPKKPMTPPMRGSLYVVR